MIINKVFFWRITSNVCVVSSMIFTIFEFVYNEKKNKNRVRARSLSMSYTYYRRHFELSPRDSWATEQLTDWATNSTNSKYKVPFFAQPKTIVTIAQWFWRISINSKFEFEMKFQRTKVNERNDSRIWQRSRRKYNKFETDNQEFEVIAVEVTRRHRLFEFVSTLIAQYICAVHCD